MRHHRHPVLNHLVGDGPRHLLELGVAEPALGDRGHQLAARLVPEQDRDAVHVHDLEGHVHDHAQEAVEVQLGGKLLGRGQQQRQLLRLALLGRGGGYAELAGTGGAVPAGDAHGQAATHLELADDVVAGGRLLECRDAGSPGSGASGLSRNITLPKVTESFGRSRPAVTRLPSIQVPLELPRSRTSTPSASAVSSARRRKWWIVDRDVTRHPTPTSRAAAGGELERLLQWDSTRRVRRDGGKTGATVGRRRSGPGGERQGQEDRGLPLRLRNFAEDPSPRRCPPRLDPGPAAEDYTGADRDGRIKTARSPSPHSPTAPASGPCRSLELVDHLIAAPSRADTVPAGNEAADRRCVQLGDGRPRLAHEMHDVAVGAHAMKR